jgi:CheY-like chemotaxis protein
MPFRTPLHGIMGSSECLQGTPLDAFQSGLINTIETCGKTLLDTFDNLLSFAKINNLTNSSTYRRPSIPSIRIDKYRNGIDSVQSRVDLSILTAEVVDTAFAGNEFVRVTPLRTGMANGGNVSAHSETGLDAITVLLDYDTTTDWVFATQAGAWIRIILNLVGNSLKYTERGRVTVRLGQRLLPNPLSEDDVEVTLTVSDTGCGMSEDFIAQSIFSPFVQEDSLSPGTGLGLSIVKQIITSMGGTISVESKKDQGTTFSDAVCMTRDNSAAELEKPSSLSAVAAILPDKRFNMIIPEGEHDETNFVNLCSSWFSVPILCTPEPVEAADVYFVLKRHVSGLKRQLASRSAHVNTIGKKPVIILCKDVFSAESLRSSKSLAAVIPRTEFLSQPLAPTKIAKILIQCFERPTYKKSDSNSTIIRPVSRSSSISSQRPRMHRLASDVSQISSPSNPEVMVFTPMEEKTKEALLFRVNASVEAVRQAEVLEAQKQASLPHFHNASSAPCVSVLLVDDNSINLNLLAMFMRKQRHAYDTATNGLEAFKAYQAYSDPTRVLEDSRNSLTLQQATSLTAKSFDFVLMDLNMPVMDGLESTRQIRAFERAKGLRPAIIVALTGMSSASAQQEAFASGVDLFLTKPVRLKELTKIFEQNTRQFF